MRTHFSHFRLDYVLFAHTLTIQYLQIRYLTLGKVFWDPLPPQPQLFHSSAGPHVR